MQKIKPHGLLAQLIIFFLLFAYGCSGGGSSSTSDTFLPSSSSPSSSSEEVTLTGTFVGGIHAETSWFKRALAYLTKKALALDSNQVSKVIIFSANTYTYEWELVMYQFAFIFLF